MKEYVAPAIVEYGPMTEITLGTGSGEFDDLVIFGYRIPTPISCSSDFEIIPGKIELDCN